MKQIASNSEGYKVGDYLYSTWGYEQTNVDFYKVVGVTAKTLKIVPVKSKTEIADSSLSRYVVPTDEINEYCVFDKNGDIEKKGYMTKRINKYGYISISDYAKARKWDGRSVLETSWY